MPAHTKSKKPVRKVKKGTQSTRQADVSYSSGNAMLAPRYIGKMRYVTQLDQPFGTSDVPTRQIYRATSIFDPDESKVGFQPSTHDELSLFYNHYLVTGAKITVKALLQPTHVGSQFVFLSRADDTTTTNRNNTTALLNDFNTKHIRLDQDKRSGTIVQYYSKNKMFGKTRDSDLTATFGTNPSENVYFHLSTVNHHAAAAQSGVQYEVTIEYTVMCTERKAIGTS